MTMTCFLPYSNRLFQGQRWKIYSSHVPTGNIYKMLSKGTDADENGLLQAGCFLMHFYHFLFSTFWLIQEYLSQFKQPIT